MPRTGGVGSPSAVAALNCHPTQQQPQAHANQEYVYKKPTTAIAQITAGVNSLTVNGNAGSSQSNQYNHSQGFSINTSSMTHSLHIQIKRPLTTARTIASAQTSEHLSNRGIQPYITAKSRRGPTACATHHFCVGNSIRKFRVHKSASWSVEQSEWQAGLSRYP